jgi:hypothetical protein
MNMPFPGMDPYLEHPLLWPGVHHGLIHALATGLQPLLEPRYVATVEQRVFIEGPQRQIIPDVNIHKRANGPARSAAAVADAPVVLEVGEVEVEETYVEIRDLYANEKLVALIEIVSPTNKKRGPGMDSYLHKQEETLARECHLVEIDLLRRGQHVLSVPEWRVREALPAYDYLVCVSRWPFRNRYELYARSLREPLPRVALPLTDPDPDVVLDLQPALEQVYWEGRFMRRVHYDQPCQPPLSDADQQWATECWAAYRAAHPELFPPPPGT